MADDELAVVDNLWRNPAAGVELTDRERRALMTGAEWDEIVTRYLAQGASE